ncbi:MAG TPA: DUF2505 domain-containing protein [Actinomycetaceae bacterium]|nr:DUF2505 domain-containing protein [Actinomycetaceae bacterium]
MKRFTTNVTYSVPAARVREIQTSEDFADFLVKRFAGELGAEVRSRGVAAEGGATAVTATVFVAAEKLPAPARNFFSDGVEVTIRQRWDAVTADGVHPGEFHLRTKPDKATVRATFELRDVGAGSTRDYAGELSVNIPLVGRLAENEAVKNIDRILGVEKRVVEAYVKERGDA